jgi:hypothetical protein
MTHFEPRLWKHLGRFALAAFLAASVIACGDSKECERCESDADCESEGLLCRNFPEDGSKRCASGIGATTCRSF